MGGVRVPKGKEVVFVLSWTKPGLGHRRETPPACVRQVLSGMMEKFPLLSLQQDPRI